MASARTLHAVQRLARALAVALGCCAACTAAPATPLQFEAGADLSFLEEVELRGQQFRDARGAFQDPLALLKSGGLTSARLRVWNAPAAGFCDLQHTLAQARRLHAAGLTLWLDLHYADHWADPGQQPKPAAWAGLHGAALEAAVEEFTRAAVAALAAQGTPADTVQLGNEITAGLLWEDGRLDGSAAQWDAAAALLRAGARGARAGAPAAPPRLALHVDRGADNSGARGFFDAAVARGVPFDVLALSYYPWWHGDLGALAANLNDLAARYQRDLVVIETAYPYTTANADAAPNFVTSATPLLAGYPATPPGQAAFLDAVNRLVRAVPAGRGRGVYWWAPEWLPVSGMSEPNPWDNQTLFDLSGAPLPALGRLGSR